MILTVGSITFVLLIERSDRHEHNITVHQSEAGARDYLAAYCEEWSDGVDFDPEDPDGLIESYFENTDEAWSITQCRIRDGY